MRLEPSVSWRTEEQKQAALKAGRTSALAVFLEPAPFQNRGFSERTIRALLDCSVDAPERLLFMRPADLKKIPGVGKASFDEIMRYRAKFIRPLAD
jgi:DNA-directed RNA polymerase alpha subunit